MSFQSPEMFKPTSAPLLAASFIIGEQCKQFNDLYMACTKEKANSQYSDSSDPSDCIPLGYFIKKCIDNTFVSIKNACQDDFESFWKCLDINNQDFIFCRQEEEKFYRCMQAKMVYYI